MSSTISTYQEYASKAKEKEVKPTEVKEETEDGSKSGNTSKRTINNSK